MIVRVARKDDITSITTMARELLEKQKEPAHFILVGVHEECIDQRKDIFLSAVTDFATILTNLRPDCSLSVATVPLFNGECRDANSGLVAHQAGWKYETLDLTKQHRELVMKGKYEYGADSVAGDECSKILARKACSFFRGETFAAENKVSVANVRSAAPLSGSSERRPRGGARKGIAKSAAPAKTPDRPAENALMTLAAAISRQLSNQPRLRGVGSSKQTQQQPKRTAGSPRVSNNRRGLRPRQQSRQRPLNNRFQ